jgi:NADH dehydrogenase FAD-containing subunit
MYSMGKHLVFVGGGHAHLTALKNLSAFINRGHRVTLISPSPYHYYSGMGPGMLGGSYQPWDVHFHIEKLAADRGATFIQDKVVTFDPLAHRLFLQSGRYVQYDVVSFNTGSTVPVEVLTKEPHDNVIAVKPVVNLLRARNAIVKASQEGRAFNFAVIGGGAAGVEISGNLWRLLREQRGNGRIVLIAGERLMPSAPDKVRRLAIESLGGRDIQIVEGKMVESVERRMVTLNDQTTIDFDVAFVATGVRPASMFLDSGIPTGLDGEMLVNARLQSVAHPDVFGGGDCISLEGHNLAKVGVYAVRQSSILLCNLLATLEGGEMMTFTPQAHYLLIFNMGNGKGIFWKRSRVFQGRLAYLLKNYLDRRFMKAFQVSGEHDVKSDAIE